MAFVEDIPYRRSGSLFADGKPLEKVPRLAIAANLGHDIGQLILLCDEEWSCLGTSGAATVDDVKADAERNYPGVVGMWPNKRLVPTHSGEAPLLAVQLRRQALNPDVGRQRWKKERIILFGLQ
jgi:hypothetical protein